jgi:hypothetical protein
MIFQVGLSYFYSMPEIVITQGYKRFHLLWEQIHQDQRCRRIKVYPVANPDKYLILENNEPLIRVKLQLKHRRIDWKLIEGPQMNKSTLDRIIREIEHPTKEERITPLPVPTPYDRKKNRPSGPLLGERNKG